MNAQMNTNADINIKGLFTMLEGWDEAISVNYFICFYK